MKKIILSQNQVNNIIILYNQGKSTKEIGEIFNVSSNKILSTLKKSNVLLRNNQYIYIKYKPIIKEISEYRITHGTVAASVKYGLSVDSIRRLLKKYNLFIVNKKDPIISESEHSKIIDLYVNKKQTLMQIGKIYNVNFSIICQILKNYNIKRRNFSHYRKYPIKDNYFSYIDSHKKAYILGFLYADGYNSEKSGKVRIGLAIKDEDILKKINNEIQFNKQNAIKYISAEQIKKYQKSKNSNGICYLVLYSKQISKDLAKIGCYQNKSLTCSFPLINKKYLNSFIAGYFDGDGCLTGTKRGGEAKNYWIQICCSYKFGEQLKKIILENLEIESKVREKGKICCVLIQGHLKVLKFMEWIYSETPIFLDRKMKTFLSFREDITNR